MDRANYLPLEGSTTNDNIYENIYGEIESNGIESDYTVPGFDFKYYSMVKRENGHFTKLLTGNVHKTIVYCLVFWSFGTCVGFLGPTLWDLGCQTGTILPSMTWVFFSQSLFILIGSVISGILIEKFTAHPVLLTGIIGICCTLAAIPFCVSMTTLALTLAVMGLSMGLIDTTANVLMIKLYTVDVSPFLQALHFCYGIGAFLSPMIAEPFLYNFDCTLLIQNTTGEKVQLSALEKNLLALEENQSENQKMNEPQTLADAQKQLQVNDAFWILTILQFPIIVAVFSLWYRNRGVKCFEAGETKEKYVDLDPKDQPKEHKIAFGNCCVFTGSSIFVAVIFLAGLLLFFADGMQAAYGGFVFSYGRLTTGIESSEAALLNASFWGMFAAGRGLAIFLALFLSPGLMLIIDIFGSSVAMIIMLILPSSKQVLYFGTLAFGFFLSSIYPSTISLAEQFVDIGPSSTSSLVVCAAMGEMVFPVVIGHLVDKFGAKIFIITGNLALICMVFVFITFAITGLYARKDPGIRSFLSIFLPFCLKDKNGLEVDGGIAFQESPYGLLPEDAKPNYGGVQ